MKLGRERLPQALWLCGGLAQGCRSPPGAAPDEPGRDRHATRHSSSPLFTGQQPFDEDAKRTGKRELVRQRLGLRVLSVNAQGLLIYDESIRSVEADAKLVLSDQIRHSVLQVTHV